MNPDDFDDARGTMAALHRAANDALDERPAARVRAAVLAVAAREAPSSAFGTRHWPRSLAAVLVVSVLAGLVVARVVRDEPERLEPRADRTVASAAPSVAPPAAVDPPPPPAARPSAFDRPAPPRAAPRPTKAPREKASAVAQTPLPPTADAAKPAPPVAFVEPSTPPSRDVGTPAAKVAAKVAETAPTSTAPAAPAAPRTDDRARTGAPAPSPPAGGERLATFARRSDSPETLVERIVRLRRDAHDDDADRLLTTLRSRYPDFVVPPEALRADPAP